MELGLVREGGLARPGIVSLSAPEKGACLVRLLGAACLVRLLEGRTKKQGARPGGKLSLYQADYGTSIKRGCEVQCNAAQSEATRPATAATPTPLENNSQA